MSPRPGRRPLPRFVRRTGRALYEALVGEALDLADRLRGRTSPLTPPRRLWHLVTFSGNDFHASGAEFREFLAWHGLKPEHRILDVGCGLGRVAVALTSYLAAEGAYEGFDVMPVAIRWCQRITAAHPNFRFRLADVKSHRYRPGGTGQASAFAFPYPDAAFDFVVLSSVFTHMLPADMTHYLDEIARVLKPGGRAAISYYLMTPERRAAADERRGALSFPHKRDGCWIELADEPEAAVAYDEADVLAALAARHLAIDTRYEGTWATTREQSQDVFVVEKRA
jgi:SAM-dependent methyltransferase